MALIAVNKTGKDIYLGGKIVYAGTGEPIEPHQVNEAEKKGFEVHGKPLGKKPIPTTTPPTVNTGEPIDVAALLKKSVEDIKMKLDNVTDQQLLELEAQEKRSLTPRTSLLGAITKEMERRTEAGSGQ